MSNAAKDISTGLASMGGGLRIPRTGFRGKKEAPKIVEAKEEQVPQKELKTVSETEAPKPLEAAPEKPKAKEQKKVAKKPLPEKPEYDRITFEITVDQRATLTSIASDLHYRSDKNKREGKINRDMIMRSVLEETVKLIPWDSGVGELHTENDIRQFVRTQLKRSK